MSRPRRAHPRPHRQQVPGDVCCFITFYLQVQSFSRVFESLSLSLCSLCHITFSNKTASLLPSYKDTLHST